jgi:hypothetical protein
MDNLIFIVIIVISAWVIILGFLPEFTPQPVEIKSPHPITPRIEIHINSDGSMDTTYIYKEVGND